MDTKGEWRLFSGGYITIGVDVVPRVGGIPDLGLRHLLRIFPRPERRQAHSGSVCNVAFYVAVSEAVQEGGGTHAGFGFQEMKRGREGA